MLNIMSNECCKEFSGWFKSFTKIERALAVVEAILLVILIAALILLILHLIVCSKPDDRTGDIQHTTPTDKHHSDGIPSDKEFEIAPNGSNADGDKSNKLTEPGVKCSWTPSPKTTAAVHYYEDGAVVDSKTSTYAESTPTTPKLNDTTHIFVHGTLNGSITTEIVELETDVTVFDGSITAEIVELETGATTTQAFEDFDEFIQSEQSDGEEAEDEYKNYVVALVKLKPPKDVIFGCILTIVTEYWTLTAASCIEAIEETDSLDSFVIMEQYGSDKKGPLQTVDDVQIHPLYEGRNRSYDLAALKCAGSLVKGRGVLVELASFLDYALTTIGERLTILGYGAFRSIDKSPSGRRLRRASVRALPARQCAGGGGGGGVLRHLVGGAALPAGAACGAGALCAGAAWARALPCNYCGGAPLLRRRRLLGVMADNLQCGVACEPALYVNVAAAAVADWIRATTALRGE